MMLDTMGVIIASNSEADLGELTRVRSVAALPFGGRYRLIDFPLSSMVNSGIINVGMITDYNYQSLLDNIGSGKPGGLARKKYGLFILPPFSAQKREGDDRLNSLIGILHYLKRSQQKYVVLAESNIVCNIPFDDVVKQHKQNNADLTMVYTQVANDGCGVYANIYDDKIIGIIPSHEAGQTVNRLAGYCVFTKDLLVSVLERCSALNKKSFLHDVIGEYIACHNTCAYKFDGYLSIIRDVDSYYKASMELMSSKVRKQLFFSERPILTKFIGNVPAKYLDKAKVTSSLVADGCTINGTVENCILFRGVTVEEGACIKDSILMQDAVVSQNVRLSSCVLDKNTIILKDKELVGQPNYPVVVGKRRTI